MPKIVKIPGIYQLPQDVNELDNSERFDYIYNEGIWLRGAKGESRSGSGSMLENTKLYLSELIRYLHSYENITENITFFDAPCGDLNWIQNMFSKVDYIGGDISKNLISDLQKKYSNVNLRIFDIANDKFPNANIWHCRHCHFHLSLSNIAKSLENLT